MAAGNALQIIGAPGNSPALQYEVDLTISKIKASTKELTLERVNLCFSKFDELIPKLGIFQRIMTILRNEFQGGSKLKKKHIDDEETKPIKVPYFTIAKRSIEEKDKEVSKLKKQIHSLKEQLYTCEADLEKASSTIEGLKHTISDREDHIVHLTKDLEKVRKENYHLTTMSASIEHSHQTAMTKMENKVLSLLNSVSSHDATINDLKPFKLSHDKLQKKFSSVKSSETVQSKMEPYSVKNSLEHEMIVVEKLEQQILQMQNIQIEQYEKFLDKMGFYKKEDKTKLKVHREKFKLTVQEIDKELSELITHKKSLQFRLNQLSSSSHAHPQKAIIDPTHPLNPLVTQEQPLNKYSAMLYVSDDNGLHYFPIKDAKHCNNCGEKVILCSHWSDHELIIQLPLHTTHIKFIYPLLHSQTPPTPCITSKTTAPSKPMQKLFETAPDPEMTVLYEYFTNNHGKIVYHSIPRQLSKQFLLNLMSKFYQQQLIKDEVTPTNHAHHPPVLPFVSSFFEFIIKQYPLKYIAVMVIRDYISALEQHHQQDIYLLVLSHILSGGLDGVVFRYQLLYGELISQISWDSSSPDQFIRWAGAIYSDYEEDELEQLSIDYASYSHNVTTQKTVMEFLTIYLIKHRDLSVKQAEFMLTECTTADDGVMNEAEFAEACLKHCSKQDTFAMRLYAQTIASSSNSSPPKKTTSIRTLAYILGYVKMLANMDSINERLNELNIADGLTVLDSVNTCNSTELMTLTNTKNLK